MMCENDRLKGLWVLKKLKKKIGIVVEKSEII